MTLIIKKSLFPYPIFVLHSMFYVPRAVHESGLYPTRTQPDLIECGRFRLATNSNEVSNQSSQVVSVFECESVGFRFFDIVEFWPKSSQILSDLV